MDHGLGDTGRRLGGELPAAGQAPGCRREIILMQMSAVRTHTGADDARGTRRSTGSRREGPLDGRDMAMRHRCDLRQPSSDAPRLAVLACHARKSVPGTYRTQ